MAWTVGTYESAYMGGTPSNVRSAMFELCRAVNQRQAAFGITKTQFRDATGALASDIIIDDFERMFATGDNVFENLTKIRDAIITMLAGSNFTTTSAGTTVLTKAAVETAIGTDIDADPLLPNEARYWQAMQDALDLMIYGRISIASTSSWTGASSVRTGFSAVSKQAAWTAAIADTPAASTNSEASWTNVGTPGNYNASIYDTAYERFALSSYGGSIVAGSFVVNILNGSDVNFDWLTGTVTGTLAQNVGGGGSTDTSSYYWTEPYSTGGNLDIPVAITTSVPSTNPFITFSSSNSVRIGSAIFYTDLASILTDQA